MKILFCTNDPINTQRPDVSILFGKYGPRWGLVTDLLARRADPGPSLSGVWSAGKTFACRQVGWGPIDQILRLLAGLRVFVMDLSGYDALQVRDRPLMAVFWCLAAKFRGCPFFYWMSFPDHIGYRIVARESRGLRRLYFNIKAAFMSALLRGVVLPFSDHLFLQSDYLKAMFARDYGISPDKMTGVPMGVDMDHVVRIVSQLPASRPFSGRKTLVYLGVLDPVRRIDILIDVVAKLKNGPCPDIALLVIGDTVVSGETDRLKAYAKSRGLEDSITWTGWLTMSEAWRRVRTADIALSLIPPVFDFASPTKTLEYMAVGLPVVVNEEIDDQCRVVGESGAGLCVPFDIDKAAEAIETLVNDENLRRKMAEAGPPYIERTRSYRLIAETLVASYRRLLS